MRVALSRHDGNERPLICRGRIAGHPCGLSGPQHVACPLCSATAADGSLLVGAGHAPPTGTSLPPETLRIAMDTNSTVGAVVPDAPLALPHHPGSVMATNCPLSVGAGLQGTLAGHPARDMLPVRSVPRWPRMVPYS